MVRSAVRFARSADGTAIAWTKSGSGVPLVRAGVFITNIEAEPKNRVFGRWSHDLAANAEFIRYDERGCGLSDRDPEAIGEDVWVDDLDSVIGACGAERVALFGMSQGAALAIAYAAAHPDRVSHLILLGGYAAGGMAPGQPAERGARTAALAQMNRLFWHQTDPSFRRAWTMRLIPDGSADDLDAIDAMQRASSSGDMAADILLARDVMDVRDRARSLDIPTLVAHGRGDLVVDFENGVELATLIPNSTLLPLDTRNHLLLDEPAWGSFVDAVRGFLGAPSADDRDRPVLTKRELDVLECVALGRTNVAIANELSMSVRTVERHLSNVYRKLGVSGKSARAAAVGLLPDLRRSVH